MLNLRNLNRIGAPQLLWSATLLVGMGVVMVYSASAARSEMLFGSAGIYWMRQLVALALGGAALYGLMRVPLPWLAGTAYLVWGGAVVLLILTLSPLGVSANGASRWVGVGPLVFQPLELAKLGVILALARWLSAHQDQLADFRISVLMPALLAGVPCALLLLQPDFGGALLICAFTGVLVFAGGARLDHLLATAAVSLPPLFTIAVVKQYRLSRLETFLDPWADPLGSGYQLVQSQLAFGAGGLTGAGLGVGQQKLFFLPEAHTDFILSVIGEEVGLIGVLGVLACFAALALASMGIAARAKSAFGTLLAVGASLLLWLQAMVNAGVAMGALPTTGTTLPFLSYGRTSLVVSLAAVGVLLNVARPTKSGRGGWR